ncbi:hypothetical protein LCGC14_0601700, partial [marine sediment metagenome]
MGGTPPSSIMDSSSLTFDYNYGTGNPEVYYQKWNEDFTSSQSYMTQSYEPDSRAGSYTMDSGGLNMQNTFPVQSNLEDWAEANWPLNSNPSYTNSSFTDNGNTGTLSSTLKTGSSSSVPSTFSNGPATSGDLSIADDGSFSTFISGDPSYYNGQEQLWNADFATEQSYMAHTSDPDMSGKYYNVGGNVNMDNQNFPTGFIRDELDDYPSWNLNYDSQVTSTDFGQDYFESSVLSQSDTYVPVQAQTPSGDFDMLWGTSDFAGDLSLADSVSYTTFDSSIPAPTNHYPAPYSFENLADYTSGTNIDFVDYNSYPVAQIIPGIDGHNKVLELTSNTNWNTVYDDFDDQASGTMEWWVRTPQSYYSSRLILYGNNGATQALWVYFLDTGYIGTRDGGSNVNLVTYTPNTWIHMRVDFYSFPDMYFIYVNEVEYGPFAYINSVSAIDRAYFDCGGGSNIRYLDAIAYSWTPGYTVGDNLYTTTGHFPGTYSFENDAHGASGTAISMIDEFTGNPGAYLDVVINDVQTDHKKVLRVVDSQGGGKTTGTHNFDNPQTSGTIEFWLKMSGSYGATGSTDRFSELYFRASNNQVAFGIQLKMLEGGYVSGDRADLSYWDGSEWIEYADGEDEVWYRNRIDFDCEDDKYSIFTYNPDGTLLGSATGIDFENDLVTLDEIYFTSIVSHYRGIACYDAFGFTWEGYNIGDNRFDDAPGIMTFEIDAQLDSANRNITSVSLEYSYQNVDNNQVSLRIYNYAQQNWDTEIDSFIYSSFNPQTYAIFNDYYDQNYNLKFRFEGLPSSSSYEFYLDQFKINYNYFPSSGNIYADISKTISSTFLNQYDDPGFPNYQKLYNITVSFDYIFTTYPSYSQKSAKVFINSVEFALSTNGLLRTFSETFEFDSASLGGFPVKIEILNGFMNIDYIDFDITFKCIEDPSSNIFLQQTFTVNYPEVASPIPQFVQDNGAFFIDTDIEFHTVSDGKTYINKYGSTHKLQIIFNIYANGAWRNNAYIYNISSSITTRTTFDVAQWMTNKNYDSFEDFSVEYVMIGDSTDLIVNDLRLSTYQTLGAPVLDVETTINVASVTGDDTIETLQLLYAYKTDNGQPIEVQIWNYNLAGGAGDWEYFDSTYSEFLPAHSEDIDLVDNIDINFNVKFRFLGTGIDIAQTFNFYIDQFRVDATWTRTQTQSDTYVPVQAQTPSGDFDMLEGTSDFAGDLSLANGVSYTTFDSSIPAPTNHYPATYSFENLADYTSGTDIDFVDYNGYPFAQIIPGLDGHNKVLELTSNTNWNDIYNDFPDKVGGTIEWWVRTPQSYYSSRLILYGNNGATEALRVYFHDNGYIITKDGGSNVNVVTYTPNTWIHMRVSFSSFLDLYFIRVKKPNENEVEYGPYSYVNPVAVDRAYFDSGGGSNIRYLDAIAYSWTPGYTIGD